MRHRYKAPTTDLMRKYTPWRITVNVVGGWRRVIKHKVKKHITTDQHLFKLTRHIMKNETHKTDTANDDVNVITNASDEKEILMHFRTQTRMQKTVMEIRKIKLKK